MVDEPEAPAPSALDAEIAHPVTPQHDAPRRRVRTLSDHRALPLVTGTVGLVVGLALGAWAIPAVGSLASAVGPTPIESAFDECEIVPDGDLSMGDDGASLSASTGGEDSPGAGIADVSCLLYALDVPDSVVTRIDSTRALDGRQTASWGDFDASWGYHPDSGLDLVVEPHRD